MAGVNWIARIFRGLERHLKMSRDSSDVSTADRPGEVRPDEALSSFVYRESDIDKKTGSIRHSRLLPRPARATGRLETSVCRSSGLSEPELWSLCTTYFDPNAPKPAIGHGVGAAYTVMVVGLQLDPDGVPYPQHANIVGWELLPGATGGSGKDVRVHAAKEMARRFVFRSRGRSSSGGKIGTVTSAS